MSITDYVGSVYDTVVYNVQIEPTTSNLTLQNGTGYVYVQNSTSGNISRTIVCYILNRSGAAMTLNNARKQGALGIDCYVDGGSLPSNSSVTIHLGDGSAVTLLENDSTDSTFSMMSLPNTRTDLQYLLTTFE